MEEKDYGQLAAELENYINNHTKHEDCKVRTELFNKSFDVMPLIGDTIYCPENIIKFVESHKLLSFLSVIEGKPYIHVF